MCVLKGASVLSKVGEECRKELRMMMGKNDEKPSRLRRHLSHSLSLLSSLMMLQSLSDNFFFFELRKQMVDLFFCVFSRPKQICQRKFPFDKVNGIKGKVAPLMQCIRLQNKVPLLL